MGALWDAGGIFSGLSWEYEGPGVHRPDCSLTVYTPLGGCDDVSSQPTSSAELVNHLLQAWVRASSLDELRTRLRAVGLHLRLQRYAV